MYQHFNKLISLDLSYNNNIFVLIFEQILVSKFQKIEQDFPPSQKYEKNISDFRPWSTNMSEYIYI